MPDTFNLFPKRWHEAEAPLTFKTKDTRSKEITPLETTKKRYTDKRNAEKETLRSDYILVNMPWELKFYCNVILWDTILENDGLPFFVDNIL
jgi:hypothetical protein